MLGGLESIPSYVSLDISIYIINPLMTGVGPEDPHQILAQSNIFFTRRRWAFVCFRITSEIIFRLWLPCFFNFSIRIWGLSACGLLICGQDKKQEWWLCWIWMDTYPPTFLGPPPLIYIYIYGIPWKIKLGSLAPLPPFHIGMRNNWCRN